MSIKDTIKEKASQISEAVSDKLGDGEKDVPEKTGEMSKYMADLPNPPEINELIEGTVIGFGRGAIYLDLPPFGTGIIYGREYINARDIIKNSNIGDLITAKVVDTENEEGYIELSLKEARQALIWSEAESAIKNKTLLELTVKEANKGGLIIEWQGISGFLPASQLSSEHYPHVEDGDKDKILSALRMLVGTKISVLMINADPKEGKLIFSEKGIVEKDKTEIISKYNIGDEVDCTVTGIVDFGVFLKIEDDLEGLVHISELDWGLVEDPKLLVKVGEQVKAKIIEIKDGKISLSIKALKDNPWKNIESKYKKDDVVDGVVIKFNKYGALVSIEEGIAGLAHVSEFETTEKMKEVLELGKTYKFKISLFEPSEHKMTLSYQAE